jgi:hypothetical protein
MAATRQDTINDALERLHDLGFTMEHAFSEHGPMVAEAISTLGFDDDVAGWVESYKAAHHHNPPPPPKQPIDGSDEAEWRNALGDHARTTDWHEFFRRELDRRPWPDILRDWVPILTAGYFGGLTHGLIRTAHAVRSFPTEASPSDLEFDELARGLGYWAGVYQPLPGNPDLHGNLEIDEALRRLPRVDPEGLKGPLAEVLSHLPGFASAVESGAAPADPVEAISHHTAAFARVLIAHPEVPPIPLVHAITAPTAMQNLLPYVPPDFAARAYRCLWQASAAIVALFATPAKPDAETDRAAAQPTLQPDELVHRAIAHGDEHTIKLTEACLREDRIRPDPAYRAAAEAVLYHTPKLGRSSAP